MKKSAKKVNPTSYKNVSIKTALSRIKLSEETGEEKEILRIAKKHPQAFAEACRKVFRWSGFYKHIKD